jgi:hypothetical protein
MVVYANVNVGEALRSRPQLDRAATLKLASTLFPKNKLVPIGDGDLSCIYPPDNEVHIGCFPDVSIVAAKEFGIDYPSKLPKPFIIAGGSGTIYLHAMHSVVDWFACAQWNNGTLVRSLSLSPDSGVLEDIGTRFPFEEPYWSGQHSATDDEDDQYPFPFDPLELGEATLKDFFGYQLEGFVHPALIEPESVPLVKYKRSRPWLKLW